MGRYFIYAIILYGTVVCCFLVWERTVKRRRGSAGKKGINPFRPAPKEDIIGKSKFTLRHSQPQVTTLEMSEKRADNASIFAHETRQADPQDTPGAVPAIRPEGGLISEAGDYSGEIDIMIENEPPEGGYEPEINEDLDYEEMEEADDEQTGGGIAQGIGFEELAGAIRTVDKAGEVSSDERYEAGRIMAEVRQTELFGQVADSEPKKKIVSALVDEYFAAYYRGREVPPTVKAPADFNVRSFA